MIDWWNIGIRWRDRHASIVHGDVVRAAAAFARQEAGERAITPTPFGDTWQRRYSWNGSAPKVWWTMPAKAS